MPWWCESCAVGLSQNAETDAAKAFLSVAAEKEDVPFGITSDDAVFSEYKITGEAVVLFKKVIVLLMRCFLRSFSANFCISFHLEISSIFPCHLATPLLYLAW